MPRIRCRYEDCVFLEEGYCGAAAIELEPELGCLTYTRVDEAGAADAEKPEADEFEDEWDEEEDELYEDDEEDDTWDEEDEEDF